MNATFNSILYDVLHSFHYLRPVTCYWCYLRFIFNNCNNNKMISNQLVSFHIIERESGKNLIIWTYPTISEQIKSFLTQISPVSDYICLKKSNNFIYIRTCNKKPISIVIISREYDPDKYRNLLQIFSLIYQKKQNPVDIVELYLKCFTSGTCDFQENGTIISCNLKTTITRANLKGLIKCFNYEIILIYIGILLKRRLLLYHSDVDTLQKELFSVIDLIQYRKSTENVYPLIENIKELKGLSHYIAGTCKRSLQKDGNFYDLFINIEEQIIQIPPQAEEIMATAKIHKDLATVLMKLSLSDSQDYQIRSHITKYTERLLDELQNLATTETNGVKMITVNDLKMKKFNSITENFLFHLAIAENMMIL